MSTYCNRFVEMKIGDVWVQVGQKSDNFHGFDTWQNPYANRGIPKDSIITKGEYQFNHSYITINEIEALMERSITYLKDAILESYHQIKDHIINKKLDYIMYHLIDKDTEGYDKLNDCDVDLTTTTLDGIVEEYICDIANYSKELEFITTCVNIKLDELDIKPWDFDYNNVRLIYYYD